MVLSRPNHIFQSNVRFLGIKLKRKKLISIQRNIEFASKYFEVITDKIKLQRLLGNLNYISPFIKDLAKDIDILYDRLRKNLKP